MRNIDSFFASQTYMVSTESWTQNHSQIREVMPLELLANIDQLDESISTALRSRHLIDPPYNYDVKEEKQRMKTIN